MHEACTWCHDGGELLLCDYCDSAFCENCLTRHLGQEYVEHARKTEWKCLKCDATPLAHLRYVPSDSSDADSDDEQDQERIFQQLQKLEDELEIVQQTQEDDMLQKKRDEIRAELQSEAQG
jgi:hypothetical protein